MIVDRFCTIRFGSNIGFNLEGRTCQFDFNRFKTTYQFNKFISGQMKSLASRFLLLWLFLWACACVIPENYTKASTPTLVPNIRTLAYSHDQRILVVIQQDVPSAFYVFDGIRLSNPKFMQVID
jgi:hypothetical protein